MACKHRVRDNCKKDGRPCIFSEKCFEPEKSRPKTNADRIRAMRDEELAELFVKAPLCRAKETKVDCRSIKSCVECLKDWLQQPAESANQGVCAQNDSGV